MTRASLFARMVLILATACLPLAAQETASSTAASSTTVPHGTDADWSAIAASAERFAEAFNSADAAAIAKNFAEHGEYVDADGNVFHGRDAIEAEFTAYFAEGPRATIEIDVKTLRFLASNLAVEEGTTYATFAESDHTSRTQYTAIHTKQGSDWLVASVRDSTDERSKGEGMLSNLSWMIGEWMDESRDSMIETNVYWDDDGRYLIRDFNVVIEGSMAMKGTQRIGWDPLTRRVKSWVFDSEGGRMEGLWTQVDDGWLVKSKGVTSDGEIASATHLVTPITEDSFRWVSLDRVSGDEQLPDISLTIVRRPPSPKSAQAEAAATDDEGGLK